jgi:hypothetical protein
VSLSDFEPDELEGLQQKWPRIVGAMLDMERTIETQAAEIERLRASLDEAHLTLDRFGQARTEGDDDLTLAGRIVNLEADRLAAEASLDEAVRVLRPFAVKINRTYDTSLTPDQIAKAEADDAICGFPFTNRQVRAAFAFITKHSGGERG